MTKRNYILLLLLAVCATASAAGVRLTVGPLQHSHEAYPVVVRLADYPELTDADKALLGVFVNGRELSSQLDDLDGDGVADELAFLLDIPAGKRMQVSIRPTTGHLLFPTEVHAQMYLKSKTPEEGFVPHTAEGKSYYIKPVTEQTFLPDADSYRSMHHHSLHNFVL